MVLGLFDSNHCSYFDELPLFLTIPVKTKLQSQSTAIRITITTTAKKTPPLLRTKVSI